MQKLKNSVLEMKEFSVIESFNTHMLFKTHLFHQTQHRLISVVPYINATFFILSQALSGMLIQNHLNKNTMK